MWNFSKIERDCYKNENIEKIKMKEFHLISCEFLIKDIIKASEDK